MTTNNTDIAGQISEDRDGNGVLNTEDIPVGGLIGDGILDDEEDIGIDGCSDSFENGWGGCLSKEGLSYAEYKELGEEYIRDLISKTEPNGRLSEDLITFDFRLGNTCNLQCVMCRPKDSSRWLGDAKKLARMLETDAKYDWESKIRLNHDSNWFL